MLFAFLPTVRAQDASAPHLAKRGDATAKAPLTCLGCH